MVTRTGFQVSSVPRLLMELAPREDLGELDRLITQAVRKGLLNLSTMEVLLAGHARRPGIAKLKAALRDYRPRPERKSGLERAFDELIADGDIPPPQKNVIIAGWEIDCYWPEFKLAVELDGRNYHSAVRDMERDRVKDAELLLMGIRTVRITDLRFALEPRRVQAELVQLTRRAA